MGRLVLTSRFGYQALPRVARPFIALLCGLSTIAVAQPEIQAISSRSSPSHSKKEYRRQTDQQLNLLAREIDSLSSKGRTLKGISRIRLTSNIRTLRRQLRGARALWKTLHDGDSESWLKINNRLNAKIIRLNKSYTYILNTLHGE